VIKWQKRLVLRLRLKVPSVSLSDEWWWTAKCSRRVVQAQGRRGVRHIHPAFVNLPTAFEIQNLYLEGRGRGGACSACSRHVCNATKCSVTVTTSISVSRSRSYSACLTKTAYRKWFLRPVSRRRWRAAVCRWRDNATVVGRWPCPSPTNCVQ